MIYWDETTGNGITYQGDTGLLLVTGLDPTQAYTMHFAVQNSRRKIMGEQSISTFGFTDCEIHIPTSITDKLIVPLSREYEDYYWFLKVCKQASETEPEIEDTLFIGDSTFGDKKILRVYPKGAEGIVNA